MPPESDLPRDVVDVVVQIAERLKGQHQDYAIGGAIALGYWATPRGTVDADVTLYLPPDRHDRCIELLEYLGCEFLATDVLVSLREHGFCRVRHSGLQLDVFLPTIPFYDIARRRRQEVPLDNHSIMIWDAETLCVFKMMFFRLKDLADVEAMLKLRADQLDRGWVRTQLIEIYGKRDPRIARWDELSNDNQAY